MFLLRWPPESMAETDAPAEAPASADYLLLLHEGPTEAGAVSRELRLDLQRRHRTWARELARRHLLRGCALPSTSMRPHRHGRTCAFYRVAVEDRAEAERLALECPRLAPLQWMEVRRVD